MKPLLCGLVIGCSMVLIFDQLCQAEDLTSAGPATVGDLGDVRHLRFEGATSFPVQDLRNALRQNIDFLLAAHPTASFAEYTAVLERLLNAGYLNCGFPEAKVRASLDRGGKTVLVRIHEGRRYLAGEVTVTGAKTLSTPALIRHLTEPLSSRVLPAHRVETERPTAVGDSKGQTEFKLKTSTEEAAPTKLDRSGREVQEQPPIWRKGKPASFHPVRATQIKTAVTNALAELGYLFPRVKLAVVPADDGTAILAIDVQDEGPRAVLGEVEIEGHERNSRQAILTCLKIQPGMPVDQPAIEEMELRLWRSGRFLTHTVTPERTDSQSTKVKVHISLMESPGLPTLTENLSAEDECFLRCRDWLSDFRKRDEDLVLTLSGLPWESARNVAIEAVVSPSKGALLSIGDRAKQPTAAPHHFILAESHVAWCSPGNPGKLVFTNLPYQVNVFLNYKAQPDPSAPNNLEFGAGFRMGSTVAEEASEPFRLETHFAPAPFLAISRRRELLCRLEQDQLVVRNRDDPDKPVLRIDAASGRLLTFQAKDPDSDSVFTARFERGAFEKRLHEIESSTANRPNVFAPDRPLSSLVQFLAGDPFLVSGFQVLSGQKRSNSDWNRIAAGVSHLLNAKTLAPLDRLFADALVAGPELFQIPPEQIEDPSQINNAFLALASAVVFRYFDDLFPKQSWPWTLAREAVFVLNGRPLHTDAELQRLYESGEVGPIGFLTLARALARLNSPDAQPFAVRGLVRLTKEDFQKDSRLILQSDSVLSKSVCNAGMALGKLDETQLDALCAALPDDGSRLLRTAAGLARQHPETPAADILSQALDEFWEQSMKEAVRAALREVLQRPAPAPAQEASSGPATSTGSISQ